ncbi:MAG: hypothetical protein ACTHOE_15870 [Conexibacter sp.]
MLVYLWPALIGGHVLAPTALLYGEPMWQGVAPAGVAHWMNSDLGDVVFGYFPWDVLARRLLHAGTFPAWNAYAFGGTPLWGNAQVAWLSPFSLPLWLLPLRYGLGIAAALKLWCAGFGAYLLGRELRLGLWPALLAGAAFALCSFNVVWLSYGVLVSVAAMLPWTLWLSERVVRRGRVADALWLAVAVGVAFTGGHPGTQVHLLGATALYALVRSLAAGGATARRERATRLALTAGAAVLGVALAAVVLLPAQLASHHTVGVAARMHGAPTFAGSQMPPGVARTVLFPEWWGRPSEGVALGPHAAFYRERTFYAGAATAVLALVALLSPGAWRRKAPFALLGVLGLAIALRAPGLYDLVIRLPGFDRVQNARIGLWLLLALALLAGFGLQHVLDTRGRIGRAWLALAVAGLAGVAAIVAIAPAAGAWPHALSHMLRRGGTSDADTLALASALWWLAFAAILAVLLLILRRRPQRAVLVAGLATLVVALDVLHVAHGYQPMLPASAVVPPRTPAIAFLQRHRDDGRMTGVHAVPADVTSVYGLRDVVGFDAPYPTFRFARLLQMTIPAANTPEGLEYSPLSSRVYGLLGARYLLLPPGAALQDDNVRPVYRGSEATIYANALSAPRAFVPATVRLTSGGPEEYATIAEDAFDPRREATLRSGEIAGSPPPLRARGTVHVIAEDDASVTLRATLAHRGLVVLDDTWGAGWSVEVDGRPAQALQANAVLRAVIAPAGTHEIAWRYRVPGLRAGTTVSGVALLLLLACAGVLVVRARRAPPIR